MSSSTLDELVDRYAAVSVANQRRLVLFAALAESCHRQRIDFLLLKGGDLLDRLYDIRGLRPLSDIDLLVRPSDLERLDALLTAQGYRRQLDGNPAYESPDGALLLDVISNIWYSPNQNGVWARRTNRQMGNVPVSGLGTEDLVVYLMVYSVVHRGSLSHSVLEDVRRLLLKERPDWGVVVQLARESALHVPLHYGLQAMAARSGIALVPAQVMETLAPRDRANRLKRWILTQLVAPPPLPDIGHLLMLLFLPWNARLTRLAAMLVPPKDFLRWRYGTTGEQSPHRIRFRRIATLFVQTAELTWKIAERLAWGRR